MEIKEKVLKSSDDATILYQDIHKNVYKIVAVKDVNGCEVEFYDLPFALYVPERNTQYKVEYVVKRKGRKNG